MRSAPCLLVSALVAACNPATPVAGNIRAGIPAPSVAPSASAAPALPTAQPSTPPPAAVSAPPAGPLPALYAALFDKGHGWKLAVTVSSSHIDQNGKNVSEHSSSKASCTVTEVVTAAYGLVSTIDCQGLDDNGPSDPFSGAWIATRDGLFHAKKRGDIDPTALSPARAYLAADPKESRVEKHDGGEPDSGSVKQVKRDGKGFCVEESDWSGDDAWTGLCFAPDKGVTSGSYGWGGGSVHETKFRASP